VTLLQVFAQGVGMGAGGMLAVWAMMSMRDFLTGFLEARSERFRASAAEPPKVQCPVCGASGSVASWSADAKDDPKVS
jgi:hypothetical protein